MIVILCTPPKELKILIYCRSLVTLVVGIRLFGHRSTLVLLVVVVGSGRSGRRSGRPSNRRRLRRIPGRRPRIPGRRRGSRSSCSSSPGS